VLADEAERAIDAALSGPLPEIVGRLLVERQVPERVLTAMLEASAQQDGDGGLEQLLANPALQRVLASDEVASLAETTAGRVLRSPAFQSAAADFLASPDVRRALAESAGGYGEEAATAARGKARGGDDRFEAWVHRLLGRPRAALPGYGGVVTRGIALALDALLAQLLFLVGAASIGLVLGLAGDLRPGWLSGSLAGGGWLLAVIVYFTAFWSGTGQTPGMRLMRLRVLTASGAPPSWPRALLRLVGLLLAIIPLLAGFLPALFDSRRRALPDYVAGTTVVYEP
jgi:uncharacterized RDD family membrane protein YckC